MGHPVLSVHNNYLLEGEQDTMLGKTGSRLFWPVLRHGLCMIQISRFPSPSRGPGTSHFSSKKSGDVPGDRATLSFVLI